MSNFIVGVTGGIASGKSSVTDIFKNYGIEVIDADVVAREVVDINEPAYLQIKEKFGVQALFPDGTLNRGWLREHIFSMPDDKLWLNNLLHPLIRERMLNQCHQAKSSYCILAIPLLFENNLQSLVDRILVIDVNEEVQLTRAVSRDRSSQNTIKNIIASQASREDRLAGAHDVIDNSGEKSALNDQIAELHKNYLRLSSEKPSA